MLVRGTFRHDQEMLLGPRVRDGVNGYFVITPMERPGGDKILVNRGWIPKARREQKTRKEGLPTGEVIIEGLLRAPWKKNYFTPDNRPDKGEFYFSDVAQMAALAGAKPVWIEETMRMDPLHRSRVANGCRPRVDGAHEKDGKGHSCWEARRGELEQ